MLDENESEEIDVFNLSRRESLNTKGDRLTVNPNQSTQGSAIPSASNERAIPNPSEDDKKDSDEPLDEDEGKDDETLDEEIDQRRVAMRDAFRKLLGQKLGSIYVTNHQERKPKPKLPYYVRVNHNVIDYREVEQGRKKRYTYNFNTGECKLDIKVLGRYHIKRFFKKLDQVSADITNKVSLVYEEPKKHN